MTRAYLRLDPAFDEHKEAYPDGPYAALIAVFCLAESQTERGRFRNRRFLRSLLGRRGRHLPYLLEHEDLIELADGRLYVDGWDEWQEGDWKVQERVKRLRERRERNGLRRNGSGPRLTPSTVAGATVDVVAGATVDATVDATPRRQSVAVGGKRSGRRCESRARETVGTWFDEEDPEHAALVWLSQHNATLEPNGRGLHLRLIRLVKVRGIEAVLAAFEELAKDPDVTEANQFVLGADNRLVRIPRAPGPVEEPWERDLRETRERIETKREAARQAGQAGQTP